MPERLTPAAFRESGAKSRLVLDLRPLVAFARGHVPGAISVPFAGDSFLPSVADVTPPTAVALIDDVPFLTESAVQALQANGYDVTAILDGGTRAWEESGLPLEVLPELSPEEAAPRLGEFTVIDVREPWEKALGDIPGSRALPLSQLVDEVQSLDPTQTYLMACRSGVKSVHAQAYLGRHGLRAVNLKGGVMFWELAGLPLE